MYMDTLYLPPAIPVPLTAYLLLPLRLLAWEETMALPLRFGIYQSTASRSTPAPPSPTAAPASGRSRSSSIISPEQATPISLLGTETRTQCSILTLSSLSSRLSLLFLLSLYRWSRTFPEYFAIASASSTGGAVISVWNAQHAQATPTPFPVAKKPLKVADFDFFGLPGEVPRIAAAVGHEVVIFAIGY
jgi:hypothetical protein